MNMYKRIKDKKNQNENEIQGDNQKRLTVTISPFVAINTGASVCIVTIHTCPIHTWVRIAIVEFYNCKILFDIEL